MTFYIPTLTAPPDNMLQKRWPQNRNSVSPEIEKQVKNLVKQVKINGDSAIIEFTKEFDGVSLSTDQLMVTKEELVKAYEKVTQEQILSIKLAKKLLTKSVDVLIKNMNFEFNLNGITINYRTVPLESVGCYIPGGNASYPSSVIMTAATAKVVGVPRVVVCSPPRQNGNIPPLTLVTADICGVNEIYKIGGAHAIAALAYGTTTIKPVQKITGPGNQYVLMAKLLVKKDVEIDLPAGPSEILIFADDMADPTIIALDLISQAEHGKSGSFIFLTTSTNLAIAVEEALTKEIRLCPNKDIVAEALASGGLILILKTMDKCISFINRFSPEHLELLCENAKKIAQKITSAGIILLGKNTPVAASDYCLGTNHVLPTGGFGRIASGLSAFDFVRRVSIVKASREGLLKVQPAISTLAKSEGLFNHALAVERRFQ